ncbi:rod shape-determining protein MreD [Solitalea sp. MAHUQ-68]|uniref:Rod shape-determining protein MreD n=1 Tax=Solitalea agri TaxID=2953739 RepID=A0A9X2JBS4_9SPHI|nr:rod shape-determining protein MreD [Solitalea agri]MCO4291774.1 rod shape-determining protein MreD [Solitalea agri]
MIRLIAANVFRFIFLVLFQVFFLPNLSLYNIAVPYLYVMFIILLPVNIDAFWVFVLSFLLGISIDAFSNTLGLHTAACVLMAFCRGGILSIMIPKGGEFLPEPTIRNYGFRWFFTYSAILVVIHHVFLLNIEYFRLSEFLTATSKAIISSAYTLTLIIISQYLFGSRRR